MTSITFEGSVHSIGNSAFRDCTSLTSITIPGSVTSIGGYAFYGCTSLASITIQEGATSIGKNAFIGCTGLTSITIPEGVTSIGNSAFSGCTGLTSITIPEGVTSIGYMVFSGCTGLTSITIPESVTSIDYMAFRGCSSLTSITIPEGVTSIGNSAFSGCTGLTSVNLPESLTSIGAYAFYGCTSLSQTIIIPSNVWEIASYTFSNCSSLPSVRLRNNVYLIDAHAFEGCTALKSISFPPSLRKIGKEAFRNCSGLVSIKLPSNVEQLESYAFADCENLESVILNSNVAIDRTTFENDTKLKTLESDAYYYDGVAIYNKEKTKLIEIHDKTISRYTEFPETTTEISEHAFDKCTNLTTITIPYSITSVGNWAFTECTALKTVNISSLKNISDGLFYNCTALNRVMTSTDLESVGNSAFGNCSNLKSISLSAKSIGSSAFSGCSNLQKIYMQNVESLGSSAFSGCSKLEAVNMQNVESLGSSAFSGCSKLEEVNIPLLVSLQANTFSGCSALKKANIQSCSVIGDGAFDGCTALQSIQVQTDSLKSIGKRAFKNCSSLTSPWEFLNRSMTIADSAFIGCLNLKKIRVRREDPSLDDLFAENMVVYVPEGCKETYQSALPQCTIYEDYNGQKYQEIISMYKSYNQPDFKPLVDEEADVPLTGNNVLIDASQLTANFADEFEGSLDALVDSSDNSFYLSAYDADNPNEDYHYIQADLKKGYMAFNITFKRRNTNDKSAPTKVHVFATNAPDDDNSWIDLGIDTLVYNDLTASIYASCYEKVRYVRLQVEATVDNTKEYGNLFFALNKLDIKPCRLSTSIPKWDDGSYYAIKNWTDKNFLAGTHPATTNRKSDAILISQYKVPIKNIVIKYLKADENPIQTMKIQSGNNADIEFNADYRYFGNTTGVYCVQLENATNLFRLLSADDYNSQNWNKTYSLRSAHVYTRSPRADLMSENAKAEMRNLLSQYDGKDFLRKEDAEALQNYCNEITRISQTGRFADFAKHEYRTFYADYPAVVPMLVKAGIVKEEDGELVVDYIYNEGDVIPANTGVILKGNCLGNAYVMEEGTTDATSPEGNLLHGTVEDEETHVDGCSRYYMLSYDKEGDSRLGFYWSGENGPHPFINKAYKAYLAIPDTNNAMGKDGFSIADMEEHHGETTSVSSTCNGAGQAQGNIYSIDGRKVENKDLKQLPAGLYIVNGKKILVK